MPPPYTSSPRPALLLPYSPSPSQSFPIASTPSSGFDTLLSNHCYCRQLSAQDKGRPPTMVGPPHWSGTRPYLTQISAIRSRVGVAVPLPAYSSQRHSSGCSDSPLGLGSQSAWTWGGCLGVTQGTRFYPPSSGCWSARANHSTCERTPGKQERGRGTVCVWMEICMFKW